MTLKLDPVIAQEMWRNVPFTLKMETQPTPAFVFLTTSYVVVVVSLLSPFLFTLLGLPLVFMSELGYMACRKTTGIY